MASTSLLRRGNTWFARYNVPQDRWADVGQALGAKGGVKREIVRTLQTTDYREAQRRRERALGAIRADVDAALVAARLRPLTDWTAAWETRAVEHREAIRLHGRQIIHEGEGGDQTLAADIVRETIEGEADVVECRQGLAAAEQFRAIALKTEMTVAQAARQWLAGENGRVRNGTIQSHHGAFRKLGAYLANHEAWPSLEGVAMTAVTRRIAGEVLHSLRETTAAETVQRDFSAYSGLWRWAVRRGYVAENPWADQTAGLKAPRKHDEGQGQERAFSTAELVTLLRAGPGDLAPARGGYAATFWDLFRLCLLTGARPSELLALEIQDVIQDGTALALGRLASKTHNAKRIMPLHPFAQAVITARLAVIPAADLTAPLWPEVPPTGVDQRRSKIISNRFPAVRRRLLGESDEVDLYSFRRSFMTAAETALHGGGRINPQLLALLVGHQRDALSFDLYSDWSRMGRSTLRGTLAEKLTRLREAVEDVVELGFDGAVKEALTGTSGARPAMKRLQPAFRRN